MVLIISRYHSPQEIKLYKPQLRLNSTPAIRHEELEISSSILVVIVGDLRIPGTVRWRRRCVTEGAITAYYDDEVALAIPGCVTWYK